MREDKGESSVHPHVDRNVQGCWLFVEAWNAESAGAPKTYPWGNPPLGYWVFDAAGNASVQISINPALSNLGEGTTGNGWWLNTPPPVADMIDTFNNYMAYFGTYTVSGSNIDINVAADVLRVYNGVPQVRPFFFNEAGDLCIGDDVTWLRRLVRVSNVSAV
jgi:hypothetical protein